MYIGNTPAENYASFLTETFSVSATANYTLSHAVTNENEIRLVINGVVQQPGSGKAYTASGTTLTLTSATSSGDSMYAVYLGRALQTVNPPNASVGTAQLADDAVSSAKIASGVLPTNTPSFLAYRSSTQGIPNSTDTTIVYNAEVYDTASAYNTSNGIFTVPSGQGGKYYVTYGTRLTSWNYSIVSMYLDDGADGFLRFEDGDTDGDNNTISNSGIVSLSAGATINVKIFQTGGGTVQIRANQENTWFGAFKLIGV